MMKINQFARILSGMILAGAVVFLTNCGGDDPEKPAQQVQLERLSKTWNIVSASLDGAPRTGDFTNFKLTFSGTFNANNPNGPYNYSVTGARPTPSPWPASGQWSFVSVGSGDSGSLVRSDDVPMVYSINSSGQLTLELTCTSCDYGGASGRVEAVNGVWTFVFNP
ncbi:MAG: hypothetical protein KF687_07905 [Cyclobacteriaceae bacterium]|nr:hypothetical protein [Cyclobacteriaceae bacterium]